jgi:hypothetical protein
MKHDYAPLNQGRSRQMSFPIIIASFGFQARRKPSASIIRGLTTRAAEGEGVTTRVCVGDVFETGAVLYFIADVSS